jgi:hypothetical protein
MPKGTGWLSLLGFFGLVSAAGAQAPSSPTTSTQFDGIYTLVSSTAGSFSGRAIAGLGQCPECRPGPLTVSQGRVQWSTPAQAASGKERWVARRVGGEINRPARVVPRREGPRY